MTPPSTVARALDEGTSFLQGRRPRTARLDAELLLGSVLGHSRTQLYTRAHDALAAAPWEEFLKLLRRRAEGVPVAYLIGWKEFYGRRFAVTPEVLVPRPETETIVEEAIRRVGESGLARPRLLDLCTGSGCVAVSLAGGVAEATVHATDLSASALEVAAENVRAHGMERRISLFAGDLFDALPAGEQKYDVIVSNPPYVATDVGPRPEEGVVRHEPHLALFGGFDGLDVLRRLAVSSVGWLNGGGFLVLEMATFQAEGMEARLQELGYCDTRILVDLSGLPRGVSGRWEP